MYKFLLIIFIATTFFEASFAMRNEVKPWIETSSIFENNRKNISIKCNETTNNEQETSLILSEKNKDKERDARRESGIHEDNVRSNRYSQYFYISSNNSKMGQETTTMIKTIANDDIKFWDNISEIHYTNDISCNSVSSPKVILYKNQDSSCYIVFRVKYNKQAIIFGLNERSIKVGGDLFVTYEVSEDIGSFTDNVSRMIFVDKSGLYIVPREENFMQKMIDIAQKKGENKFESSVITVSAIDGKITLNNELITENNFFDNWVREKYVYEVIKGRFIEIREGERNKLSSLKPSSQEILRNFYPPAGHKGIYSISYKEGLPIIWLKDFVNDVTSVDHFVNKRLQIAKIKNRLGCEELVLDGTFFSILYLYLNTSIYDKKFRDIIISKVKSSGKIQTYVRGSRSEPLTALDLILNKRYLFKDLDFVRNLKPEFSEISEKYEYNKESDIWIPFEVVKNI